MQTPQTVSHKTQIETKINVFRTQIWALEMGHDFLTQEDKRQIKGWNDQIAQLYKQLAEE